MTIILIIRAFFRVACNIFCGSFIDAVRTFGYAANIGEVEYTCGEELSWLI